MELYEFVFDSSLKQTKIRLDLKKYFDAFSTREHMHMSQISL